ncbi:3-hydroxyacyl-CoA dehydrogenase [Sanguibacter keddieii DSM 10542]|uniref:3-hydroxyacyl-CoA dehydrogenase n=1 Tax=Sanguibacter keddieii (strain ATCC 51767 / DSM 10542 / NCFB 3025 / ST-74) TaxID=446469 RepID=D1BGJ4_SANKS|nr:3-hydroxyacyl-CoA dehydrogenase NAD-binding domain-containing protein [Sanguibacter keddieii]ACZ21571.1 3-hydroxyacyl-CoA dehydrogenase [Sanguibacter keddieii DSM 10542]
MTGTTSTQTHDTSAHDAPTNSEAQPRGERVTRSLVRDVTLPSGGTLALVTLDNGLDHTKPSTLGPLGLAELHTALRAVTERAARGEIVAAAVTGKPFVLAAGADLTAASAVTTRDDARALGSAGHAAYRLLQEMAVPTFAFVNGVALGGGLELALACTYRTVATDVPAIALPETSLGLVPGWGGCFRLPRIVGIEKAIDVILTRPAANKPFTGPQAYEAGIADALLDSADFLEQSIVWADAVLRGEITVERPDLAPAEVWQATVDGARARVDALLHGSRPAPYRALDLLAAARDSDPDTAYSAEDDALADLIMSDEMRASVYAFQTVNRAKKPVGAPARDLARPVTQVGIVGAGLMAAQLALLFAQRLGVPVVMRDLDDERVQHGLDHVRATVEKLVSTGRVPAEKGAAIAAGIRGTTVLDDLSGCDFVIEAVTEVLGLKKKVFAELEGIVSPETILATNTSALSVTQMAEGLEHPERVVGLHFFNPVAQMPLVEVVRAERSSDEAVATAFAVAKTLRKTAVLVRDRPGFVVNRLLVLLLGEIVDVVEAGTPVEVADRALRPLGLPMGPFALFDLVGPAVGLHVLTSLREDLGDRFPASPALEKIVAEKVPVVLPSPARGVPATVDPALQAVFDEVRDPGRDQVVLDEAGVLDRVLRTLAREVGLMLDEGVVSEASQIDLCMILGAGWPFSAGGISPYLDRAGVSESVLDRRLLPDGVANVPSQA